MFYINLYVLHEQIHLQTPTFKVHCYTLWTKLEENIGKRNLRFSGHQTFFRSKNRNFLKKFAIFMNGNQRCVFFILIWCESIINYLKSVESCNILEHSFQLFTLMERHDVITSADTFPTNKYTWYWGLAGQFLHISLYLVHIRPILYLKDLNVLGVDGVIG